MLINSKSRINILFHFYLLAANPQVIFVKADFSKLRGFYWHIRYTRNKIIKLFKTLY